MGGRGIDLSVKLRGFGKLYEGMIFSVNPNKIPRIIGKEGHDKLNKRFNWM
jgi:exosome complex RNA-binding protein Rrp4